MRWIFRINDLDWTWNRNLQPFYTQIPSETSSSEWVAAGREEEKPPPLRKEVHLLNSWTGQLMASDSLLACAWFRFRKSLRWQKEDAPGGEVDYGIEQTVKDLPAIRRGRYTSYLIFYSLLKKTPAAVVVVGVVVAAAHYYIIFAKLVFCSGEKKKATFDFSKANQKTDAKWAGPGLIKTRICSVFLCRRKGYHHQFYFLCTQIGCKSGGSELDMNSEEIFPLFFS